MLDGIPVKVKRWKFDSHGLPPIEYKSNGTITSFVGIQAYYNDDNPNYSVDAHVQAVVIYEDGTFESVGLERLEYGWSWSTDEDRLRDEANF